MMNVSRIEQYTSKKILTFAKAKQVIEQCKKSGLRVGLCNGGFDLLHSGHIKHFDSAKKLCDVLVVSVTSDRFVSARKGIGRPVFSDSLRAYMVASIVCVDYAVVSDCKGIEVIQLLKPSYYIKGPDFKKKQTPGIIAERQMIKDIGGEILYTNDATVSTTEIIKYIKNHTRDNTLFLCLDCDGTLIKNDDYFGRNNAWKKKLILNDPVLNVISFLQTKYKTTSIVVTNQSSVARGYITLRRVHEIHTFLHTLLKRHGIIIHDWQCCPDVDKSYADKFPKGTFVTKHIKSTTKRKPSAEMIFDSLVIQKKQLTDFTHRLVIGNGSEDQGLAGEIDAKYLDVRKSPYVNLIKDITRLGF